MKNSRKKALQKVISIFLAAALVIGYMPGFSMVANAAPRTNFSANATAGDADIKTPDAAEVTEAVTEADTEVATEAETESTTEEVSDEGEEDAAFDETKKVDDIEIKVSADKGVFPAGAVLSVEKLEKEEQELVDETVSEERDDDRNLAVSYTYDIKVLDKDGAEIQPDTSKGEVKVSFNMDEVKNRNLEADIYHIEEDKDSKTGYAAEKLDTEKENKETISAETDGFSYYTVEFTYNDLQYVLSGDESVALTEILNKVGLSGNVSKVEVSNEELFTASNESGEWIVTSKKAFTSAEWMKVTIDDIVYEIKVTDAVIITNIGSVDDWNAFCDSVAGGETYAGKTVELTADIGPVTTMVGTEPTSGNVHAFSGTFEGNGHVLTVSIDGSTEATGSTAYPGYYSAPFKYVNGATFQNLTVEGSVKGSMHASGLVGSQETGRLTINNVTVNANVSVIRSHCGGFVGHGHLDSATGKSNTISLNNCIYGGTLSNKKEGANAETASIGGFIGWAGGPLDCTDCSFVGFYNAEGVFHPLGITYKDNTHNNNGANITGFHSNTPAGTTAPNVSFPLYPLPIQPDVAKITKGDTEEFYTSIGSAVNAWTEGSTLTLLTDVTTTSTITVPSGEHTLNLNSYGINANGGAFSVITVPSGASLTINDISSTAITHKYSINQPTANTAGAGLATVDTTGSYSFTGGYITGGRMGSSGTGGGIKVTGGSVVMNGGTIIGNSAQAGGGVYVNYSGSSLGHFTMNGGAIIGNQAGSDGGAGVSIVAGISESSRNEFTMTGGEIKYNYTSCEVGGGIGIHADANAIISGGSITNNACASGGRGAGIGEGWLYLSGSPVIDNNYAGIVERNVNLWKGYYIVITGTLSNSTPIGVTTYENSTVVSNNGVFTSSTNTELNDESRFASEMSGYVLNKNTSGQLELVEGDTKVIYEDGTSKIGYFNTMVGSANWTDGSTLMLLENVTTTTQLNMNQAGERTLNLNGKTLTINSTSDPRILVSSGTLIVEDTNGGEIKTTATNTGRTITVNEGASLIINGGTISGNPANDNATIGGSGTITVNGGIVTAAKSNAFSMGNGGTLNLYGGTVSSTNTNTSLTASSAILTAGGAAKITVNIGGADGEGPVISAVQGSGICTRGAGTTINIVKGTISSTNGYAISTYGSEATVPAGTASTINLKGNPTITGGAGGIFLGSGNKINITGALSNTNKIGIKTTDTPTDSSPVVFTNGLPNNGSTVSFSSVNTSYKLNTYNTENGREAALYTSAGAPATYWDGNVECNKEPDYNTSSWHYMQTTDSDGNPQEPNPMKLTFSEDGTKLLRLEIDNYYINTRPASQNGFAWHGFGFGITERAMPYNYAYLYKDRSQIGMNDPNYLDEAFIVWKFSSNNSYDKNTSLADIEIQPWAGTNEPKIAHITDAVELTDADNAKFDPETTYYAHFITQGWTGTTADPAQWGTVQPTPFKISDNPNFRYSADFDYNGHGGTNFTLPMHKGETVTDTAKTTNAEYDKWTAETKEAVNAWNDKVVSPSAEGYIFGGWYTDPKFTTAADFEAALENNITYYAKWIDIPPTKPDVTVNEKSVGMIYGNTNKSVGVTVTAPTEDHEITYKWYMGTESDGSDAAEVSGATASTYEIPMRTAPGNYYYYCEVKAKRNGNGLSETVTSDIIEVTVYNRTIFVSGITAENKVYDGNTEATLNTAQMVLHGKLDGDDVSIVPTGVFGTADVGDNKTVTISYSELSGTDAANYTFSLAQSETQTTANISPATLRVTGGITASDKVYDGNITATLNCENPAFEGLFEGDDVGVSANGTFDTPNVGAGKDVTISYVGLTGTDKDNYVLNTDSSIQTVKASITSKPVTIEDITGTALTYNGERQAPTFKVMDGETELSEGTDYKVTYRGVNGTIYEPSEDAPIYVGSYELLFDFGVGNYDYEGSSNPIGFTIGKKQITVVNGLSAETKVYDGNTDANINISNFSLPEVISGDNVFVTDATGSFDSPDAGNDKIVTVTVDSITLDGTDKDNYELAVNSITIENAVITPMPLTKNDVTVSVTPAEKTYTGFEITDVDVVVTLGSDVLEKGTDYSLSFSDNKDVGTATVTVVTKNGSNYSFATGENAPTGSFEINTASIKVRGGIVAENKVYNGNTDAELNWSNAIIEGVLSTDDVGISVVGTFADKNVGGYKTVSLEISLTGPDAGNYQLDETESQRETRADITSKVIVVSNLSVDTKDYDGNNTAYINFSEAVLETPCDGDDVYIAYVTGEYDNENAGTEKSVQITSLGLGGADSGNYIPDYSGLDLKGDIDPKELSKNDVTVDVDPDSVTYTGSPIENVEVTVTYGDLDFTDGVEFETEFSDNQDVGTATVTIVTKNGSNYSFATGDEAPTASFEITKATITVVDGITAADKEYDGNTEATLIYTNANLKGKCGNDDVSVTAVGTFSDKNVGDGKTVTISDIKLTGSKVKNYELADSGHQTSTTASIKDKVEVVENPDGTTTTTTTTTDENGNEVVKEKTEKANDDGTTTVKETVNNDDGTSTETVTEKDEDGNVTKETVTEKDEDGKPTHIDETTYNDDGTTTEKETVINDDGSSTETVTEKDKDGNVTKETVTEKDEDGKPTHIDETTKNEDGSTTEKETVINNDGTSTETVTEKDKDGNVTKETVTEKDEDGKPTHIDETTKNEDGSTTEKETVINDDGTSTETVTETDKNGNVTSKTVTEKDKDGRITKETETQYDEDGNVTQVTETTTSADGKTRTVVVTDGKGKVIDKYEEQVDPDSNASKFVKEIGDAPNTTIDNSVDELADMLLTDDEKDEMNAGERVSMYLTIEDITADIAPADKAKFEAFTAGSGTIKYYDINLFKRVGRAKDEKITKTNGQVNMTTELSEDLINTDPGIERTFIMLRLHEGRVSVIPSNVNPSKRSISYGSDRFSIFAIVCIDKERKIGSKTDPKPAPKGAKTGDEIPIVLLFALLLSSGTGIAVVSSKKRKKN